MKPQSQYFHASNATRLQCTRKKKLRQVVHWLPHTTLSFAAIVVESPAALWSCFQALRGKKIFGKLVHCSCTAQDVLAHFVAVVLYESSRWMSFKTNSLPLQWRWALGVFYKMPIPFFFVCVSCLSLCPFSFFFYSFGTLEAPNKEKLSGHATYIFMLAPQVFFFFSSIIAYYYNLAPARQFSFWCK